jgi:hypothetical protein
MGSVIRTVSQRARGVAPGKRARGPGKNAKGSKGPRQGELEVELGGAMGKYEKMDHQRREARVLKAKYTTKGQENQATWAIPSAGKHFKSPICPTIG